MKFPIAFQLYTVRDDMEKDFEGVLKKVKGLGYDGVEFAGLYDKDPQYIKGLLKENGLEAVSAHVPYEHLMADTDGTLKAYADVGCKYVAIPYLQEDDRPGGAKFDETIANLKMIGLKAKDLGMTLLYHNHDFEFEKIGDEYGLDVLYKEVPADILEVEPDTCWIKIAGEDPPSYIRKYKGRVPVVHLKDYHLPGDKPLKLYDLMGMMMDETMDDSEKFDFRAVGYGMQDFPPILEAAADVGAKWVVVEQDMPSRGSTAFECAEKSINYLKSIMK